MKKILTVLLALSVVFTYTVGTAFAATPSDSKTDAINAIKIPFLKTITMPPDLVSFNIIP